MAIRLLSGETVDGDATFTGNLETLGVFSVRDASSNHQVRIQASVGGTSRIMAHNSNTASNHDLDIVSTQIDFLTGSVTGTDNSRALFLDSSRNATFTGNVDVGGNITGIDGRNIIFDQDATNYIYALAGSGSKLQLMATHSLIFNTSASQTLALTIDDSQDAKFEGTVGIGIAAPTSSYSLRVDGNTLISGEKYHYFGGGNAGIGSDASSNIIIKQANADKIIYIKADDGSGGVTNYIKVDGAQEITEFEKATKHMDSIHAIFGSSSDAQIYHNGTADEGTWFFITQTDNGYIDFRNDNGSGGTTSYLVIDGKNELNRFYKRIQLEDDVKLTLGNIADPELQIYHTGSGNSIISHSTSASGDMYIDAGGTFYLRNSTAGGESMIKAIGDGAVELYHNNIKKIETTGTGASVTGTLAATVNVSGVEAIFTTFSGDLNGTINTATTAVTQSAGNNSTKVATTAYTDAAVAAIPLGLSYQGTWNATTNTPTLVSGVGTPGYYYIVSVAGTTTLDGISEWAVGDWALFTDSVTDHWQKIDNSSALTGSGTANTVAMWSAGTVLTDAPLTFSGNNATSAGDIIATGDITATGGDLTLGADVSIFRDGANILRTDDAFHANNDIYVGGASKIFDRANNGTYIQLDHPDITFSTNGTAGTGNFTGNVAITGDLTVNTDKFKVNAANGHVEILANSGGRYMTLDAPTLGAYITFETGGTAYADVGSASGIVGSGTDTDTLMIKGRSGKEIALGAGGAEAMRINTSQNTTFTGTIASGNISVTGGGGGNGQIDVLRTSGANVRIQSQSATGVLAVTTNHPLHLKTNDTTRVTIEAGGDVGIGTTDPDAPLHVSSSSRPVVKLTSTDASANPGPVIYLNRESGSPADSDYIGALYFDALPDAGALTTFARIKGTIIDASDGDEEGAIVFDTTLGGDTNVEAMRIVGGNVGIGTDAPQTKLQVDGVISVKTGDAFRLYNAAGTGWGEMGLNEVDDVLEFNRGLQPSGNGSLNLGASDQQWDEFYTVTGNFTGNLVGTTADFYAAGNGNDPILHVKDTADTMVALFEGNRAGDTGANIHLRHWPTTAAESNRTQLFFEMKDDGNNVTKYGTIGCYIDDYTGGTEDGNLRFSVMQDGDSTEMMRVDATGVGIGTTSPDTKLTVDAGAVNTALKLISTDSKVYIAFSDNSTTTVPVIGGDDDDLIFNTGSERMRIDSAGKVGIGTSVAPFQKLTVTGVSGAADGVLENGILALTTGTGVVADSRLLFGIVDDDYAWLQAADYGVSYRDIILNPNGGNVGIRVTDPDAKLEIKGEAGGTGLTFKTTDASSNEIFYIMDGGRTGVRYYPFSIGVPSSDTTSIPGSARLFIDGTAVDVTVASTGNVGIDTTTPAARLQVGAQPDSSTTTDSLVHLVSSTAPSTINGFSTLKLDYPAGHAPSTAGAQIMFIQGYHSADTDKSEPVGSIRGWKTGPSDAYGGGLQLLYQPDSAGLGLTTGITLDGGGDTTFAGTVTTTDVYGTSSLRLAALGGTAYLDASSGNGVIIRTNGTTTALTLDSSQDATFAGTIDSGAITSTGYVTASTYLGAGSYITAGSYISATTYIESATAKFADNVYMSAGQLYMGTNLSSNIAATENSYRVQVGSGILTVAKYVGTSGSGTWTAKLTIANDGTVQVAHKATSTATAGGDGSTTLTTKGYVDSLITGTTYYRGTWDPDKSLNSGYGNPNLSSVTQTNGYYYICSDEGLAEPNGTGTEPDSWHTGDWVVWNDDVGSSGEWQKIDNTSVLSGAGTAGKIAKWSDTETLADSIITESGGNIGIGTSTMNQFVNITSGSNTTSLMQLRTADGSEIMNFGIGSDLGYLFMESNTDMTFGTNGGEKMRITSAGDVGIGTTTPDEKLHITDSDGANIILNSDANTNDSGIYMSEGADATPTQNGAYMYYDASANAFTIATGGASLADRLSITRDTGITTIMGSTTTGNSSLRLGSVGNATANGTGDLYFINSNSYPSWRIRAGGSSTGALLISQSATNGSDDFSNNRVTILNGGDVGIGTAAPAARLHVYDSAADAQGVLYVEQNPATNDPTVVIQQNTAGGNANSNQGLVIKVAGTGAGTGNTLTTYQENGSDYGLVVKGSGRVGINVVDPSSKLHVYENANNMYTAYFYNADTGANANGINVQTATTNAGAYAFRVNSASNTMALIVNGEANVGIGTASPSDTDAPLHIRRNSGANTTRELLRLDCQETTHSESKGGKIVFRDISVYDDTGTIEAVRRGGTSASYMHFRLRNSTIPLLTLQSDAGSVSGYGSLMVNTNVVPIGTGLTVNSGIASSSTTAIEIQQNTDGASKAAAAFGVVIQNGGEGTNAADLTFSTASAGSLTRWMTIRSTGVVGIGVNYPEAALSIQANYAAAGSYTTDGWAKYIILDAENTGGGGIIWSKQSSTYNRAILNNQGQFEIGRSTANDASAAWLADLVIDPDGNVGIGNDDPSSLLNVGTSSNTEITIGDASANAQGRLRFLTSDNQKNFQIGFNYNVAGGLEFTRSTAVGGSTFTTPDIAIINSGYVGIGTTSIDEKLQVEEGNIKIEGGTNSSIRGLIIAHAGQTGNTTNLVQNSTASRGHLYTTDRALRIEAGSAGSTGTGETLDFWVNGSERMMIDTTGNVGVGTTSPQELLDVDTEPIGLNVGNTAAIFGRAVGTTESRDTWIKMRASSQTNDRSWAFGTQQSGEFRFNYLGTRATSPTSGTNLLKIGNTGDATFAGNVTLGNGSQAINSDALLTLRTTAFAGLDIQSSRAAGNNLGGLRVFHTASTTVPVAQFLIEDDGSYNFYNGTSGAQNRLKIDTSGRVLVGVGGVIASSSEKFTVDAGAGGIAFYGAGGNDTVSTVYIKNNSTTADTWQTYMIFTDGGNRGQFGIKTTTARLAMSGSGGIELKTGATALASSTTALTLDTSQDATFAGGIRVNGGASTPIAGEARLGGHESHGAQLYGSGASTDLIFLNKNGSTVMSVDTGTVNTTLAGGLISTASSFFMTFNVTDNSSFMNINHSGNEAWSFKCESIGGGTEDYITIGTSGGKVAFGEDGDLIADGTGTFDKKLTVGNTTTNGFTSGLKVARLTGYDSVDPNDAVLVSGPASTLGGIFLAQEYDSPNGNFLNVFSGSYSSGHGNWGYGLRGAGSSGEGTTLGRFYSTTPVDKKRMIISQIGSAIAIWSYDTSTTAAIGTAIDCVKTHNFTSGGGLAVTGVLSKGSGSFKIDHPLEDKKDTHDLVHSFVEGPQADLIYRGKVDLVGGTATINIDTAATMTEGTFVLLNTNVQCFTTNETDWDAVKGSVSGNVLTITCKNSSSTATISWMVIGERHDQHMIDTDWTDSEGKVIVEPEKEEEGEE